MIKLNNKSSLFSLVAIIFIAVLDIYSKNIVFDFLKNKNTSSYSICQFFDFVEVYNRGVSFGLFGSFKFSNIFFICLSSVITISVFLYANIKTKGLEFISLIFISGGGIGNIYDRIFIGAVRDFLDFYIGKYHWPAFNVADSSIFIGAVLYGLNLFIHRYEK